MESDDGGDMGTIAGRYLSLQNNAEQTEGHVQGDIDGSNNAYTEILWDEQVLKTCVEQASNFLDSVFEYASTTTEAILSNANTVCENIQGGSKRNSNSSGQTELFSKRSKLSDKIGETNQPYEGCKGEQSSQAVRVCNSSSDEQIQVQTKQETHEKGRPKKIESSEIIIVSDDDGDIVNDRNVDNERSELRTREKQTRLNICGGSGKITLLKTTVRGDEDLNETNGRSAETVYVHNEGSDNAKNGYNESTQPCYSNQQETSDDETVANIPEDVIECY